MWKTSLTATNQHPAGRYRRKMYAVPLWKPYIFNWRTNDDIFVCLKYCLCEPSAQVMLSQGYLHVRQDFGELR